MAPTTRPGHAGNATTATRPLVRIGPVGFAAAVLLALPGAHALWTEDGPSYAFLHADVATPDDPLHSPLNLTLEELANLSRSAAEAVKRPGTGITMTGEDEVELQGLLARLDEGGHDGVRVNDTGYRFAIAMPEMVITGGPGAEGPVVGPPGAEPRGNATDEEVVTGEANGIAIGTLMLFSAGAMYWIRRLA